jgi:DNA-binding GntR family transcriptional regulator
MHAPPRALRSDDACLAAAPADGRDGADRGVNLSSLAYRAVSQMIQDRRLRGGETIVEQRLAEALGVSRTPLREALQRLEGQGLVRKAANRSFVVRRVDLREYLESLKVREMLEPEAAALAIGRIAPMDVCAARRELNDLDGATADHTQAHWVSDDNLHRLFGAACGNAVLSATIEALRVTTRLFEIERLADRVELDAREHRAILDALEQGEPASARRAVRAHIRSLTRYCTRLLR